MHRNTLTVNLFGGPGTGKSTTAAGVFHQLKLVEVEAELAPEYAKDKVWERTTNTLNNQLYVFGKQHHRIWRLQGQVDVVITDSPLLLSLYYGRDRSPAFHELVREEHERLNNLNVLLIREKPYHPNGRMQTESQALDIDVFLKNMLTELGYGFMEVPANHDAPLTIAREIMKCRRAMV